MFKCKICGQECGSKGISSHLKRKHQISSKKYYDKYLKKDNEDVCKICGKSTTFDTILTGYRQYCSSKCANLDSNIRAKIEQTSIEKYGVKCNLNLEETKIKANTNSQTEKAKAKRAKTNTERYGAANVFASDQIKSKIKETCLRKYGVEYASQAKITKTHINNTFNIKYGNHYMRVKRCVDTIKKNRLVRL